MKEHLWGHKFADDAEVMGVVQSWLKATPKSFFLGASASLWTVGPSVLRSGGTVSENKTQTVSVSTLVNNKKVIIKFLLFNDLPSYNTIIYKILLYYNIIR